MHKSIPLSKPCGGLAHQCDSDFDLPPLKKDSIEDVVPICEQYPDMTIFEKFCPESKPENDPETFENSDVEKNDEKTASPSNDLHQSGSNPTLKSLNLPKLNLKQRRASNTNLPQSVKNAQSVSLPNLVYPKPNSSFRNNGETPTVSPRFAAANQRQFQCVKCLRSKSCVIHRNGFKLNMNQITILSKKRIQNRVKN